MTELFEKYDIVIDGYCELAVAYADKIQPIDEYSMIFTEADDEARKHDPALSDNSEYAKKSGGFLSKAIAALKDLFNRVKTAIQNFFAIRKLNIREREEYKRFVEACKKDPSLKDKQITVKDWQDTIERGKKLAEEISKATAGSDDKDIDEPVFKSLMQRAEELLHGAGKEATMTVSINAALNMAVTNESYAALLDRSLQETDVLIKRIESTLGSKTANQFKKDVHALTKKVSLRKMLLKIQFKQRGAMESIEHAVTDFLKSVPGIPGMGSHRTRQQISRTENTKKMRGAARIGVGVGAVALGVGKYVKKRLSKKNSTDAANDSIGSNLDGVAEYLKHGDYADERKKAEEGSIFRRVGRGVKHAFGAINKFGRKKNDNDQD